MVQSFSQDWYPTGTVQYQKLEMQRKKQIKAQYIYLKYIVLTPAIPRSPRPPIQLLHKFTSYLLHMQEIAFRTPFASVFLK